MDKPEGFPKKISRRSVLKGAAMTGAAAALTSTGSPDAEAQEARWSQNELKVETDLYAGFQSRFNEKFNTCLTNTGSIKLRIRHSNTLKRSPIVVDVLNDRDVPIGNLIVRTEWRANLLELGGLSPRARTAAREIQTQLIDLLDANLMINIVRARAIIEKGE